MLPPDTLPVAVIVPDAENDAADNALVSALYDKAVAVVLTFGV
jgi:hypothetical protein